MSPRRRAGAGARRRQRSSSCSWRWRRSSSSAAAAPTQLRNLAALRYRDWRGVRRHLTLGAVALAFGVAVLAANFTQEYLAFDSEVAATQLPSVQSMLMRTGLAGLQGQGGEGGTQASTGRAAPPEHLAAWPVAAARQLKRNERLGEGGLPLETAAWSAPADTRPAVPGSASARATSIKSCGFTALRPGCVAELVASAVAGLGGERQRRVPDAPPATLPMERARSRARWCCDSGVPDKRVQEWLKGDAHKS